jgi:hypothetical protein
MRNAHVVTTKGMTDVDVDDVIDSNIYPDGTVEIQRGNGDLHLFSPHGYVQVVFYDEEGD